jgi:archaeal flagellar protein FlaJ
MIDELKRNVESEIDILREISSYSQSLAFVTPAEGKLLKSTIESLRESIKLINNSIPNLLKDVTLASELPGRRKVKTNLENIGFKRQESEIEVTLEKGDKENFLKKLSISESLIKRLKKRKSFDKEDEFKEFKAARGYLKISNRFFLERAKRMIDKDRFKSLSIEISRSNLDVLFGSYVAMMFFSSMLAFFVGLMITVFFFFFNVGFTFPFVSFFDGNYLLRLLKIFWIPIVLPLATFVFLYYYPYTEKKTIAKKIEQELPFAVIHMSAISGSGIEPSEIFKIIGLSKEYPNLRREVRKVMNQINLYGYDLVTAVTNVSKTTSSPKLAELFSGLATTINSGGDLKDFFGKRSESLLVGYRLEREKYTKIAETFMDLYISIVIAAPMILMLLLVMIGVSGISVGFSTTAMTFLIIGVVGVINVIFIGFLNVKQPTY